MYHFLNSLNGTEDRLLVLTARVSLDESQQEMLRGWLSQLGDWTGLIQKALHHRTAALLCHHLLNSCDGQIPEDLKHSAIRFLQHQEQLSAQSIEQLTELKAALQAKNISALFFKGPLLGECSYGKASFRMFGDLDFLVQKDDFNGAMFVVTELGYRGSQSDLPEHLKRRYYASNGQEICYHTSHFFPVEPHWLFTPANMHIQLDMEALWQRKLEFCWQGQRFLLLSPEDRLLHLCIHGCKEEWVRLSWLTDISETVRRTEPDWSFLLEIARKSGTLRMLLIGLCLTHRVLDLPLADLVIRQLKKDLQAQRLTDQIANRLIAGDFSGRSIWALSKFRWLMRERFSDRLKYAICTVCMPRQQHYREVVLPDKLYLLYYPVRLLHDYIALPLWLLLKKFR